MADDSDNPIKENEEQSEQESDTAADREDEKIGTADENDIDDRETERIIGENEKIPAEIDAINTDNDSAEEASGEDVEGEPEEGEEESEEEENK